MNTIFKSIGLTFCAFFLLTTSLDAQRAIFVEETYADTDFNLSNSELPSWEIIPGGPGKDGIPALTDPTFTTAKKDQWLKADDRVIGVTLNGVQKAYPIRVLNYHEVINDDFDGQRVAITYSPLSGSVIVYNTEQNDQEWELAVSGLLYNNNALYFDRETESLWAQNLGRAVAGPVAGEQLDQIPAALTTWDEWQERHPETLLLAADTGFDRNYELDTYAHYASTDRLLFPLNYTDDRLGNKQRILGITIDGVTKAYPYAIFPTEGTSLTTDLVNGQTVQIEFVGEAQAAYVTDGDGIALPSTSSYWFSWAAANPTTALQTEPLKESPAGISML